MSKYHAEFKVMIVKEYLEGSLGYKLLARKYNVADTKSIRKWVRMYQSFGIDGLYVRSTKTTYTTQFKMNALQFMGQTGSSYLETAIQFRVADPSLIAQWKRDFSIGGREGLEPKPKGRPPLTKKKETKAPKNKQAPSREKQLERENELLRLEVAFLKKLRAFQENPNAYLEKHKQQWHSNSKKKGSN